MAAGRIVGSMKYLTIIRHAKSQSSDSVPQDRDRELVESGKKDTVSMAKVLVEKATVPEMLVASPAIRARQTVELLNSLLKMRDERIVFDETLYMTGAEETMAVISRMDESVQHLAIVGHNPCMTDCVRAISGDDIKSIPTCGIAHIELPADSWRGVVVGSGIIKWLEYPKK